MDGSIFFIAFGAALLFSLLLTPWVAVLAKRFGAVQESPLVVLQRIQDLRSKGMSTEEYESKIIAARRRLDKPPLILWGGVAYVIPFLVVSSAILIISKQVNITVAELSTYVLWFSAIILLLTMGILDDVFEFSGKVQFLFHVLATFIFVLSPLDLKGFHNPFTGTFVHTDWLTLRAGTLPWQISLVLPGDLFIFLWMIPLAISLKFLGGSDGLLEGNVVIASIIIWIVSVNFHQPASALFAATLAGAVLGFLYYNFYPNKIISGSAGKSVIGFILAGLAIISNTKFAISLVVFSIPLIDMIWVLLRRYLYYKPKSVMQLLSISDKFHFHHRLLKLGYSERVVALLEYGITLGLGLLAIFSPPFLKPIVVIGSWIIVAGIIITTTLKANEV